MEPKILKIVIENRMNEVYHSGIKTKHSLMLEKLKIGKHKFYN